MSRFHVGDIVTVRPDLVLNGVYYMEDRFYSDSFVKIMEPFRGLRVTIKSAVGKYLIEECGCNWTDEMFVEFFVDQDAWIENGLSEDILDLLSIRQEMGA